MKLIIQWTLPSIKPHTQLLLFFFGVGWGGGGVLSFSSFLQAYANNLYHSWCADIVNLSISHNEHQASGERPFLMGVGAEGGLLLHTPGLSFQQSSSKLDPNWLCHWRGIAWFHTSVYQNCPHGLILWGPFVKFAWNLGTKTAASTESRSKHLNMRCICPG